MLGADEPQIQEEYLQALQRIYSGGIFSREQLGMKQLHDFDKQLGHPHSHFKVIHIAGTNGKGSVALKIASALRMAGYKTGLFTSPHISTFRERIRINGEMISKEDLIYFSNQVQLAFIKTEGRVQLNQFERTFFIACLYFWSEKVEVAIIETGIGGTYDATNVVTPLISIITSIGNDHMKLLGGSLEKIAANKAGIIKPGVPVVVGPNCDPKEVFIKRAQQLKSYLIFIEPPTIKNDYYVINNQIAKTVLYYIREKFVPKVRKEIIEKALTFNLPCRREKIPHAIVNCLFQNGTDLTQDQLSVTIDVAHNPPGIEMLIKGIRSLMKQSHQLWVICGLAISKDKQSIFEYLGKKTHRLFIVSTNHYKLTNCVELYHEASKTFDSLYKVKTKLHQLVDFGNVRSTIIQALQLAEKAVQDRECKKVNIVVLGSFYLMQEVRMCFGFKEPMENPVFNYTNGAQRK